jgi:hypothetical protein
MGNLHIGGRIPFHVDLGGINGMFSFNSDFRIVCDK